MMESGLRGRIERVLFSNPATSWTGVRLRLQLPLPADTPRRLEQVAVIGVFDPPAVGAHVCILGGVYEANKRFGGYDLKKPSAVIVEYGADDAGLVAYLESLPHVGPSRAALLVRTLGRTGCLAALEAGATEALTQVSGITAERATQIIEAARAAEALRESHLYLAAIDCPSWLVARLLREWGGAAKTRIERDPYEVAQIAGVGFAVADDLARCVGVGPDDDRRARAAAHYLLISTLSEGHCWVERADLDPSGTRAGPAAVVERALSSMRVGRDIVLRGFDHAAVADGFDLEQFCREGSETDARIVRERDRYYAASLWRTEWCLARDLRRIQRSAVKGLAIPPDVVPAWLDPSQREAVEAFAREGVIALTGGPGVGKTAVVRVLLDVLARTDVRPVIMCAPTGKAAMRMTELTGQPAATIHRTLGWKDGAFAYDAGNPLQAVAVIVDESSMIDLPLMASLLAAVPSGARLVLVGDVDQLPPVGPGAPFREILASSTIPVARLTTIHRQAAESRIPYVARDINEGRSPALVDLRGDATDVIFGEAPDPETAAEAIIDAVARRIPLQRGFVAEDIQVLCPQRTGVLGTRALNARLQEVLNAAAEGAAVRIGVGEDAVEARVGDRVIHRVNNYVLNVFNGEVGYIVKADPRGLDAAALEDVPVPVEVDRRKVVLIVKYLDRLVPYTRNDVDALRLAYAITVHSAQGSQFPAIVVPVHSQHSWMLTRALLYTAITRAEKLLVLVGEGAAVMQAAGTLRGSERRVSLGERIAKVT